MAPAGFSGLAHGGTEFLLRGESQGVMSVLGWRHRSSHAFVRTLFNSLPSGSAAGLACRSEPVAELEYCLSNRIERVEGADKCRQTIPDEVFLASNLDLAR